jgi:3-oxoacyl-[acyl-carrier protein] reductase
MNNGEGILSGRRCLVTGASRTLGADIARMAARCGAAVAVNYWRSQVEAEALCAEIIAQGGRAVPLQADVADPDQATRLVIATQEMLGGLDMLVNNFGPWVGTPFLDLPLAEYDRIMAGNVRATFILSQAAGVRMKVAGDGVIVNIAATDAFERGRSVYGLAKAAAIHLTEALAVELAPEVRVNVIAPGLIADNEDVSDDLIRRELARTPLSRLVTRREVAEVACLLCSSAFANVTGETIAMDGGAHIPHSRLV